MSFIDEYMPEAVAGYPCSAEPRWNTSIQVTAGGNERRNQNWDHPLFHFFLPEAVARKHPVTTELTHFWMTMRGPLHSFPWCNPLDKASIDHIPNLPDAEVLTLISRTDQAVGTGDGFTDTFQLKKTYAYGSESYEMPIHLPVLSSVLVANNGVLVPASDYTVSRPGGEITFDVPPLAGRTITAGYLFDFEVRFESDDALRPIVRTYQVGGFSELSLVQVRPC